MGIGFVIIVHKEDEEQVIDVLRCQGERPVLIGVVTDKDGIVL
jgi:phosphoribosylaminoimidazole (AIR) synthetase